MKLLAIETSAGQGSIALLEGKDAVEEISLQVSRSTSVELLPAIGSLLKSNSIHPNDLDALAVSIGPGSYTGVRIGIATAQGLALAANLPVYGVSSLVGLAKQASGVEDPVAVARQARAGEFFFCVFSHANRLDDVIVEEGRYEKAQVMSELAKFKGPLLLLTEDADLKIDPEKNLDRFKIEKVVAKASAIGLAAMDVPLEKAFQRGEGLSARLYSPGYRR